jgi:hypothetical protein
VYCPSRTPEAWIETALGWNLPDAQVGRQLSIHSKPLPTACVNPQRFHWMWPRLPDRKALLDTPGPPMTVCSQHPNDIVAGRTANWELTSIRKRRGNDLAASELAAPPTTITLMMAINAAAFRIRASARAPIDVTPLITGESDAKWVASQPPIGRRAAANELSACAMMPIPTRCRQQGHRRRSRPTRQPLCPATGLPRTRRFDRRSGSTVERLATREKLHLSWRAQRGRGGGGLSGGCPGARGSLR